MVGEEISDREHDGFTLLPFELMKTLQKIMFAVLLLSAMKAPAQFVVSAYGTAGFKAPSFFSDFRKAYNTTNASTLQNKMGLPVISYGYSFAFGYRVSHLAASVTRTQLEAHTSAKFTNGSKRQIDYYHTFTTVNIGYFGFKAEKSEFTFEGGMLHAVSTLYSYVIYPDKTKDAFTGISTMIDWINLGGTLRFCYLRRITDALWFDCMLQGIYLRNHPELAPTYTYGNDGTKATLDFLGVTASVGLTLKIGKHFE
jgi:hypothetical protein